MTTKTIGELVDELERAALGFAVTSDVDRCLKAKASIITAYGTLAEHDATVTALVESSKPHLYQAIKDHVLLQGMTKVCKSLQQEVETLTEDLSEVKSLLTEISALYTRVDDLPYGLLPKINSIRGKS